MKMPAFCGLLGLLLSTIACGPNSNANPNVRFLEALADGSRLSFDQFRNRRLIVVLIDRDGAPPCDCDDVLSQVVDIAGRYPDVDLSTVYFSNKGWAPGGGHPLKNRNFGPVYRDLDNAFINTYELIDEPLLLFLDGRGKQVFMHPLEVNTLQAKTFHKVLTMM